MVVLCYFQTGTQTTKWKEKQIREAVEQAKRQGYEEGYKAGKAEIREAASTNPAQVSEGEAASTSTSSSGFPEEEELLEYLKSDSFATKEPV